MIALALMALAVFVAPSAAQACRVMIPVEKRIAQAYENGSTIAVAMVEIEDAEHIREPMADTHPWKARARVVLHVWGEAALPETVEFERGWGSAACEWALPPLPQAGERWIVYLFRGIDGELHPWMALSGDEAVRFDPANFGELPG